jgi:hypothetical protein
LAVAHYYLHFAAYEGYEKQFRADLLDDEPMARRNLWKHNNLLPGANTLFRFIGDASRVVDVSNLVDCAALAPWIDDASIARPASAASGSVADGP